MSKVLLRCFALRFQADGFFKLALGFIEPPPLGQQHAKIKMRRGGCRAATE